MTILCFKNPICSYFLDMAIEKCETTYVICITLLLGGPCIEQLLV